MNRFMGFNRRKAFGAAVAAAMGLGCSGAIWAADSAVQTVAITVQEVNEITMGAASVPLTLTTSTAGATLEGTATSSYSITSNSSEGKKITAQLSSALESGLVLNVTLEAPSGATSVGSVELSESAASEVVTGVTGVAQTGLNIDYEATASAAVAPDSYSAEITYTIANDG